MHPTLTLILPPPLTVRRPVGLGFLHRAKPGRRAMIGRTDNHSPNAAALCAYYYGSA